MDILEKIFKSYDIRGVYPSELNEENAVSIARALYAFFARELGDEQQLKVVVGRDMRLSSPSLFEVISKTLVECGAEVIDIGIVSTPTVYFAVHYYKYDAGLQISASHNTGEYNGIKIVKNTPDGLIKIGKSTGMEDIKRLSIEGVDVEAKHQGFVRQQIGVLEDEVQNALAIAKVSSASRRIKPFKVVADAANAMGAVYIEELFKNISGELIKMNFDLDGTFPAHQADPLQKENLVDLQKRVVEEKADLGLAPDGDGDRLFFIDERGEVVPASIITSLVAKELLRDHPGQTVLFDIRYILTPQKVVEECGGESAITKVGHAFITEKMHETGAIFAGESSAHYFFRQTGNAESQLPVILSVLEVMSREGKKLSEIAEDLKRAEESGEINFEVENAKEIMEKVKEKYSDGEINEMDGVAISYPDWRLSLRSSNTEPLLRLNIEAYEKELLVQKKQEVVDLIRHSTVS